MVGKSSTVHYIGMKVPGGDSTVHCRGVKRSGLGTKMSKGQAGKMTKRPLLTAGFTTATKFKYAMQ